MPEIGRYYNVADQNYGVNCAFRSKRYAVKVLGERWFNNAKYTPVAYVAEPRPGERLTCIGFILPELLTPSRRHERHTARYMLKKYDVDGYLNEPQPVKNRKARSKHKKRKRKGWG